MFKTSASQQRINLALQGGGAHGAFTWGVLDRLLEDGRIDFEGVSGASAGAMNAAVLASGLAAGGRDGAREALARFWGAVGQSASSFSSVMGADEAGKLAPGTRILMMWAQRFSPQQLNPFDINPLRDIVVEQIDFERLRSASPLRLFIAATHANTGQLRLFREHELDASMLLASGCLPTLAHSVLVDGEPYWDGAFSANPAIFPLIHECEASDILFVLLSPSYYGDMPRSVVEIRARTLEIAFNATFLREVRGVARMQKAAQASRFGWGSFERRLRGLKFHLIESDDLMMELGSETRLAANQVFLEGLRDRGREHASAWLAQHFDEVGHRSSCDLVARFGD